MEFSLDIINEACVEWGKQNPDGRPTKLIVSSVVREGLRDLAWSYSPTREYVTSGREKRDWVEKERLKRLGFGQFEAMLIMENGRWFDMDLEVDYSPDAVPARCT